jgi:hypothetical protein
MSIYTYIVVWSILSSEWVIVFMLLLVGSYNEHQEHSIKNWMHFFVVLLACKSVDWRFIQKMCLVHAFTRL